MSFELSHFLTTHCIQNPAVAVPVHALAKRFRASLPPEQRAHWRKARVIAELSAAGYTLAMSRKVLHAIGLGLPLSVRNGALAV